MLAGKNALVTGSTAGIGYGIAKSYLQQGAFVFINGRSRSTVDKAIAQLAAEGLTNVAGIVADISSAEGAEKLYAEVETSGRNVDVLVNNMGIFDTQNFYEVSDETWAHYFNVNVLSTVRMSR